MNWDSNLYDHNHAFVSKYGGELLPLLAPKKGEHILDLGCGTGDLAALINEEGAITIGLDNSFEMIKAATKKYPHIRFDLKEAHDFEYDTQFDAVFSNATLHWVTENKKAITCVYNALKPNGRFVAEFGGKGNVFNIIEALTTSLIKKGYPAAAEKQPWYFPSLSEYTGLLEANGFRVVLAAHFDRETLLKENAGLRNWLQMFAQPYLQHLNNSTQEQVIKDVEEMIKPTNYKNGHWYADYVRLRIVAIKTR